MTQLYKQNGGVFIPVGITLEEVNDCLNEIQELQKYLLDLESSISQFDNLNG